MRNRGATPDRVAVYREVVGRRLMSLRKRTGLSLGALAREAEMSRTSVGRIEAGEASPNVEQLRRLTAALDTTTAQLFADADRAIGYLKERGTLIVEALGDGVSERGRLVQAPEVVLNSPEVLLRVAGATLMREIEAGLGLRADPPRTRHEAFLADCAAAGIAPPISRADERRARRELALAILEDSVDSSEMAMFGPPDPLMEDSALLEFEEV